MRSLDRRTFVSALAAIFAVAARAAPSKAASPRILFVCRFGSVKSAIARELLKRRARELQVALKVASRGITPEEHLPEAIKSKLWVDHIDPAAEPLRQLWQRDLDAADKIVIFDKLPAGLSAPGAEDWTDVPSILNDYERARADLDHRIDGLIRGLKP